MKYSKKDYNITSTRKGDVGRYVILGIQNVARKSQEHFESETNYG